MKRVSHFSSSITKLATGSYACHVCHSIHFDTSGDPCGVRVNTFVYPKNGGSNCSNCCFRLNANNRNCPCKRVLTANSCYRSPGTLRVVHRSVTKNRNSFSAVIHSMTPAFALSYRKTLGHGPGNFRRRARCTRCLHLGTFYLIRSPDASFVYTSGLTRHATRLFHRAHPFLRCLGETVRCSGRR